MASPRVRRLRKAARAGSPAPVVTPEAPKATATAAPAPAIEEICEEDPCETEECETHPEPKVSKKAAKTSSKKVAKSSAKKAD